MNGINNVNETLRLGPDIEAVRFYKTKEKQREMKGGRKKQN